MGLNEKGYGRKKNIAGTLIASGTFDDIVCIICFGICKTIVLNTAGFDDGQSMGLAIGELFIGNIVGFFVGVCMGLLGWFFKFIKNDQLRIYMKFLYCILSSISFVIMEEYNPVHDVKYICALFFGYTLNRVWNGEKPQK